LHGSTVRSADKEVALARLRHFEAEREAGLLVHVDEVRDRLASVVRQMAAHLDTIPMHLKREAPEITARQLEIVEGVITRVRNAMAEIQP
jgi:phage terminase Nu1 subunit (DNA packaging protein)